MSTVYAVFIWRKGFREDNRVTYLLLALGFLFHTFAMWQRGFSLSRCPVNNLYEATTFMGWTTVTAYLLLGARTRLRFLGAFASPILFATGVFALFPALDNPHGPQPEFINGWASLHAALILLAYGTFGLGSVAGAMYLMQEHDLKFHKLRAISSLMPPIQRLERVVGGLLLGGWILLSLGLGVGAVWLDKPAGTSYFGDAKVLWSLFVWLLYVALLVLRWQFAQGGRRLAWGAVASFAFILLTFWGTSLLSAIHHP